MQTEEREIPGKSRSPDVSGVLRSDPAMRLLRSHSSLFVIPFLHGHFRSRNLATIPSDDLETSLASYLKENADARSSLEEELGEADGPDTELSGLKENADFQARARKYISLWCSDQKEYLRRYYNKQNVPVLELTPSLERLFTFLDELKPKKFVGTESRFRTILFQLRELYQNINEDPETRIAALKKQRRQIDDEIQQIQETGVVRTFTGVQVQERIEEIVRGSRSLLGEFRQVEENFRTILQEIYRKQSTMEATKGSILGYTLDTDAKMRESAQGQSFSSFWSFIAQDNDNEIASLAREIIKVVPTDADEFLLRLKRSLYESGQKIIEQNRTLTERLNRILRQENAVERIQIKSLTAEVKSLMAEYAQNAAAQGRSPDDECMSVQTRAELFFPQARKPVYPEYDREFSEIQAFDGAAPDASAMAELFSQFYIDEKELYSHIQEYKRRTGKSQFTLRDLLELFPPQKGLSELVAWYGIANKEKNILVDREKTDDLVFSKDGRTMAVTAPRMVFS